MAELVEGYPVENYLIEHTAGSIIRDAFRIYGRHPGTLSLMYVLPSIPFLMLVLLGLLSQNAALRILTPLLPLIVTVFVTAPTTIAVSDFCLGNVPNMKRSYSKALKIWRPILGTITAQMSPSLVGFVLVDIGFTAVGWVLMVIGALLFPWVLLSPSIVMLEGRSGITAWKRSKQLGDGSHWRNVGILLLLLIIISIIMSVIIFSCLVAGVPPIVAILVTYSFEVFALPLVLISVVLIYYDRRVRKEGYDARALAEDLTR